MSIEKIKELDEQVEELARQTQQQLDALDEQKAALLHERDKKIASLRAKRDALALAIKLKEYPKALVKEHTTCSVCGALMRPFKVAQGEQVLKLWACAAGNLQETHDLVRVE